MASSEALKCYACTGADSSCADTFNPSPDLEEECTTGLDDGCSKQKSRSKVLGIAVTTGKYKL